MPIGEVKMAASVPVGANSRPSTGLNLPGYPHDIAERRMKSGIARANRAGANNLAN